MSPHPRDQYCDIDTAVHCSADNISMGERSKVSERILEIDQCFGLTGQALAVPGRVLIAEGVLTKSCRTGVKQRQFFLFNDTLVYGSILVKNVQFARQHIIPLQVRVTSLNVSVIVISLGCECEDAR